MIQELETMKLDFPKNERAKVLLARAYQDNGDYDSAVREYSDVLRKSPDQKESWFGVGEVMEKTNRLSQAQFSYQKALAYGYDPATVNLALGRVQAKQKQFAEAIVLLERSFQANPRNNEPLVEEGSIYSQQSRWDDSQKVLQKAQIISDKNKDRISYLLGVSYSRQKKFPQAEKALTDSLKLNKNNRQAQFELAKVYDQQDKNEAAYEQYQKLSNGNDAIAGESLGATGEILLKQKKYQKANEVLTKATKVKPEDPSLWNALGESAMGMGNTQEAIENYNRAIAFNTNDYRAYSNKGNAHRQRKEWSNAQKAYEKALMIKPNSVSDWEGLSEAAEKSGEYQTQIQALERIEALQPQNPSPSLRLGNAYRSKDNFLPAKKAYLRVLANDPKNVIALRSIAEMEEQNKQYPEAQTYYKKVLEVDPTDQKSLRSLGMISFQGEQYPKAEFYFANLLKYDKKDADAANRLAIAKEKNKAPAKDLLAAYERAYALDPKLNVQAGIRAAQLRKETGDSRGAIGKYEKVLNENPESVEALSEKADLQVTTKDWPAAVKSYEALHAKKAPTPESSVALAEAYKMTGQNEKAEKAYSKAIDLNTNKSALYYELALIQVKLGKRAPAKDTLQKLVYDSPKNTKALMMLGDLRYDDKEYKQALDNYDHATQADPQNADAFEKKGNAQLKLSQDEMAAASFQKAIALNNQKDHAYWELGNFEMKKNNLPQALNHYQKATILKPSVFEYQNSYADALQASKQYQKAVIVYQTAENLDAKNESMLLNMGQNYALLGDNKNALTAYSKATVANPNNVRSYLGKARSLAKLQNWNEATDTYDQVFKLAPTNVEWTFERALSAEQTPNKNRAINAFQDVIKLDPKHNRAHAHMGKLYYDQKSYDKAKPSLLIAIEGAPSDWNSREYLGEIYFTENNSNQSIAMFNQVKQLNPKNANAPLKLGMIYRKDKKYDLSAQELKSSIQIDTNNKVTHYELGKVYVATNDIKSALTEFEKVIVIDPKDDQAWYEKARLLDAKSQKVRKEQAYVEAIKSNGEFTAARKELAELYFQTEQYPNSISQYRAILKYDPDNRDAALRLAEIHLSIDEAKPAVVDLETFVKNHNKDGRANFLYGQALYMSQRETEAKKYIEIASAAEPQNSEAQLLLGLISLKLDQLKDARSYFNRTVNLQPDAAKAYYGLGQVAAKEKQYDEALKLQKKALSLDPTLMDAHYQMGVVYMAQGKEKEANDEFAKSVPLNSLSNMEKDINAEEAAAKFKDK